MKATLSNQKLIHFIIVAYTLFVSANLSSQCFKIISSGVQHNLGLKDDGTLWSWGKCSYGELGHEGYLFKATSAPIQIGTESDWVKISAGGYQSAAIKADGSLWMWGKNSVGELGDGTSGIFNQREIPYKVGSENNWKSVAVGGSSTFAIKTDGTLWAWGYNGYNRVLGLGNITTEDIVTTPKQIGTDADWKSISAGYTTSFGIKNDGSLWGWGDNQKGQLGIGTDSMGNLIGSISPVRIGSSNDWKEVQVKAHTLALKNDGSLWAWGDNGLGGLGDGTGVNRIIPTKIGSSTWKSISAGNSFSLGVKSNGTLWSWGYNYNSQLGDGTSIEKYEPVQQGLDVVWESVSAGDDFSLAISATGHHWGWGANGYGQLGDSSMIPSRRTPFEISCTPLLGTEVHNLIGRNTFVFPVPFSNILNIENPNIISKIQLFDFSGKLVIEADNINSKHYLLNTNKVSKGVYFLSVITNKENIKIKVIK